MEQPLVSVTVITYNSSKTILETLESIKAQTYPNIELIISDDCSTDDTMEICREWMEKNKGRFVRTELLTVEKNTGVSGNCNRAGAACKGEWVKGIAGDDMLMPYCIQKYVEYIQMHPDAIYVFSKVQAFYEKENKIQNVNIPINYKFFYWSSEEQYHHLIFVKNEIPAPTSFFRREGVARLGVINDERIPMMEDWPGWINLLRKGVRFHFIDESLVMYRVSEQSISNASQRSEIFNKSLALFYLYYQHHEIWKEDKPRAIASYVAAKSIITKRFYWRWLDNINKSLVKIKKAIKR